MKYFEPGPQENQLIVTINEKGGLYFDDNGMYLGGITGLVPDTNFYTITVNLNYLEEYPVYTVQDEVINIESTEEQRVILIPEKYNNYLKELIDYYKSDLNHNNSVRFYSIKDNQEILNINTNQLIKDIPIIEVLSDNNLPNYTLITGGSFDEPIKVRLQGSVEETYNQLLPLITTAELDDQLLSLVPLTELNHFEAKSIMGSQLSAHFYAFLTLSVLVFVIFFTLSMHFYIFGRTYVIKRVNGYSFYRTYQRLFLIQLSQYIILMLVLLGHHTSFMVTMLSSLILIGIEMVIILVNINSIERKHLQLLIKE